MDYFNYTAVQIGFIGNSCFSCITSNETGYMSSGIAKVWLASQTVRVTKVSICKIDILGWDLKEVKLESPNIPRPLVLSIIKKVEKGEYEAINQLIATHISSRRN